MALRRLIQYLFVGNVLATTFACTVYNTNAWGPLIESVSEEEAIAIDSTERDTDVIGLIHRLTPTPTPTPRPVGLVAAQQMFTVEVGRDLDLLPSLRTLDGDIPGVREVEWSTSNSSLVSIDTQTGRIRGASPGTAVIYARFKGSPVGSARATLTIEVLDTVLVEQVSVTPASLTLTVGESRKAIAEVRMANGEINGNVNWSSSDDTIARVNRTTGEVNAVAPGRVTIVATYALESRYRGLLALTVVGPSPAPSP